MRNEFSDNQNNEWIQLRNYAILKNKIKKRKKETIVIPKSIHATGMRE